MYKTCYYACMKKIVALLSIFMLLQGVAFASQTNLSFIYINGSNNNDEKMKNWYETGVKKLHPVLKKRFEKNKNTKVWFNPKNGIYKINEEPVIFFWGYNSQNDLNFVKSNLDLSRAISSFMAYKVRSMLTAYLHDAIWVQKSHNMYPIINNLNDVVKSEYKKGNEVILYGYSAGTFITYNYIFNKLPYLNIEELFDVVQVSDETRKFIRNNPQKNTCIAALADAKIGVVSAEGHLLLDKSENFNKNYLNLDKSTENVCAPAGSLKGIVNFASPLVLFYSDLADPEYEFTYYNKLMMKYIMENGLFWITVNFREDPLGFPTTRNLTPAEMQELAQITFDSPSGLIYDNSGVWSKRSFAFAHTAYWNARRPFANAIVKTLTKGMRFNYDENYQMKILKKNNKRDEL